MADSEGNFTLEKELYPCRHCDSKKVQCQVWESSCGGYEDYKYSCPDCGKRWWVDGIDS